MNIGFEDGFGVTLSKFRYLDGSPVLVIEQIPEDRMVTALRRVPLVLLFNHLLGSLSHIRSRSRVTQFLQLHQLELLSTDVVVYLVRDLASDSI
jgi:hypothetical protein